MIWRVSSFQRIYHNGQLAAVTIADQAIIAGSVSDRDLLHVQAKCLYALELADMGRSDGYTDADAEMYARAALMHRRFGHLRAREAGGR